MRELEIACASMSPAGSIVGNCAAPVQNLARRVDPVLEEDVLELRDDRTLDPDHRLPPLGGVARVALPAVVDPDAAAEPDPPSTVKIRRWVRLPTL